MNSKDRLNIIFTNVLGIEVRALKEASISMVDQWDSFAQMMMIAEVEEEFNVTISSDEVLALQSYMEYCNLLESKGIEINHNID